MTLESSLESENNRKYLFLEHFTLFLENVQNTHNFLGIRCLGIVDHTGKIEINSRKIQSHCPLCYKIISQVIFLRLRSKLIKRYFSVSQIDGLLKIHIL